MKKIKKAPAREAFSDLEYQSVLKCMQYYRNRKTDPPYDGIYQKKLESAFSSKMNGGFSIAVNSGSSASYIAIKSLQLKKNEKILMSPVSDSSTLLSIILAGLRPVILDSSESTYNTDIDQIKKAWRRGIKAIYLVHSYGSLCADILRIKNFCDEKNIPLIEDCSQSPFAYLELEDGERKYAGEFGHISCFSTMYRKTFNTSSSGGIVFTRNEEYYRSAVEYSDRGRRKWNIESNLRDGGDVSTISHNFNTSELNCASGISSLRRIDEAIEQRMMLVRYIIKNLSAYSKFLAVMPFPNGSSPFLVPITFTKHGIGHKKELFREFDKHEIPYAQTYPCFAYDWNITKLFFENNIFKKLTRSYSRNVSKKNAARLKANTFNIYLHEGYDCEYLDYIISCFNVLKCKKIES